MDNFEDLKELWQSKVPKNLPNVDHMLAIIKKEESKKRNQLLFSLLGLMLCFGLTTYLFIDGWDNRWSTELGLVFILITVAFTFFSFLNQLRKDKINDMLDGETYINTMKEDIIRRSNYKDTNQNISFIMLLVAYSFFIYEPCSKNTETIIMGYSIFLLVIILLWFVVKPMFDKYSLINIEKLIYKIDNLKKQFNNE